MILRASNLSQFLGKILGKLFQQKFMERFCNSPCFGQAITKLFTWKGGGCLAKRIVLAWFCGPLTILFNCLTTFSLVTI